MIRAEVERLLALKAFPDVTRSASLVETHISWVLLTDSRAYKLKKPLRYSFADFSTLPLRKFFCERELELNRRLTSGMYLGVIPVCQTEVGPRIGACAGCPVIDYVVAMVRQDNRRQMHLLLQMDAVEASDMRRVAGVIAPFHKKAERVWRAFDPKEEFARFKDIESVVPFLDQQLGPAAPELTGAVLSWLPTFLQILASRLNERIRLGFRIDGHGDLHSKNIFLLEEGPVVFDCIEFNDAFRQIDVLDEIAFLCMDLDYHGKPELAAAFREAYCRENRCFLTAADELIFHYYKFYRANIRLKVNCLRAMQETDARQREVWLRAVRDYFALFSDYFRMITGMETPVSSPA